MTYMEFEKPHAFFHVMEYKHPAPLDSYHNDYGMYHIIRMHNKVLHYLLYLFD